MLTEAAVGHQDGALEGKAEDHESAGAGSELLGPTTGI